MKPFLKWAGNKYKILDKILPLLPKGDRLIEPFVGTGAVFLNTNYKEYILADSNKDLINLYIAISKHKYDFIDFTKAFFTQKNNTPDMYYKLRDEFNNTKDNYLKAALFIYLNRHAYNGLCRYNKQGKFNTPFGKYKKPYFPEKELRGFIEKINKNKIAFLCQDFEKTMMMAQKGDVVYCDPPYVPLSETANFTDYSSGGFTQKDQIRLVSISESISKKGVFVLISNHNTTFTQHYYKNASKIIKFDVRRSISCNGKKRAKAPEILAVFG